MLRCLYLICLSLTLSFTFSRAADPVKKTKQKVVLQNDTATVQVRSFDQTAFKNYGKQAAFKYNNSYIGPSPWTVFWKWFWDKANRFFSIGQRGSILKYFLMTLGLCALVFLILRLVGVDTLNIFRRKPISASVPYAELLENIHDINFDEGIEKAVNQHNYRLAVRLLYLKCLKQLSDTGQIRWEINKTNNDYISELSNPRQRTAFNLLTRQFEYIWYGQFSIDATVFAKVNALFYDFKAQVT